MRGVFLLAALSLLQSGAAFAQCQLPYKLENGQTPDAGQLMANYDTVINCLAALVPAGNDQAVQTKLPGGTFGAVGPLTDGQVILGVTGSPPVASEIVGGPGIAIAKGPGTISISAEPAPGDGRGLYSQVMSATPTSVGTGLTGWLNQGTATVSDTAVGISISAPPVGGDGIVSRTMQAPTPPYKITALLAGTRNSPNYPGSAIGWYNGSNRLHLLFFTPRGGGVQYLAVSKFNSPTSFSSTDYESSQSGFSQPLWLQISDDGTNIAFSFSQDGANFQTAFSTAKAAGWLGASGYSNIVVATNPQGSPTTTTILSWRQE